MIVLLLHLIRRRRRRRRKEEERINHLKQDQVEVVGGVPTTMTKASMTSYLSMSRRWNQWVWWLDRVRSDKTKCGGELDFDEVFDGILEEIHLGERRREYEKDDDDEED
ncbi:hypothetical protein Tco_0018434 [Tanacetum coccineum]